jgi:hypothetical protein
LLLLLLLHQAPQQQRQQQRKPMGLLVESEGNTLTNESSG